MTAEAKLQRLTTADDGTLGLLTAPGLTPLYVLELPDRDNTPCKSRIPAGRYLLAPFSGRRFRNTLQVTGVHQRSYILAHGGNFAGDSGLGYITHSAGCLLTGTRKGTATGATGKKQKAVFNCRAAQRLLMAWFNAHGARAILYIQDETNTGAHDV